MRFVIRFRSVGAPGRAKRDSARRAAGRRALCPQPSASRLQTAMQENILEWLASVDSDTASVIAERVAQVMENFHKELRDE